MVVVVWPVDFSYKSKFPRARQNSAQLRKNSNGTLQFKRPLSFILISTIYQIRKKKINKETEANSERKVNVYNNNAPSDKDFVSIAIETFQKPLHFASRKYFKLAVVYNEIRLFSLFRGRDKGYSQTGPSRGKTG